MKQRLVVKVGTSTLMELSELGDTRLAQEITRMSDKFDIVLVTSGAIGFGLKATQVAQRPEKLERLQALSSIGQLHLMQYWQHSFGEKTVGQVLITNRELGDPTTMLPLVETIHEILNIGAQPIINENDAITDEEIAFGDNDRLAALLAICLNADHLILLTDQNGVIANFGTDKEKRLPKLKAQDAHNYLINNKKSSLGSGGMLSKLIAAEMVRQHGIAVYIADGREDKVIESTLSGITGTKLV